MYLSDRIDKYAGKRVMVVYANRKSKYQETLHMIGTVKNCTSGSELGVLLDDVRNSASKRGLFWYNPHELKFIDELEENGGLKMEGNFRVAVVELECSYSSKEYGFALFDENVYVGDTVVVNPQNKLTLAIVKAIYTKEEYAKNVTKEVVDVVDLAAFNKRTEERENAVKLEKEKKEIQKELDKKIAKLKDLEFYERMSKELGEKDPEIAEMVEKLKELSA
ncbi:hypothetical protein [Anaerosporobacter sp.]